MSLNYGYNYIRTLPKLPLSIKSLNITCNEINGILDLRCYEKLHNLLCSGNKITELKLNNCNTVNTLCCSSNKFNYLILQSHYINTINCTSNNITEAIIHFNFKNMNITYNPLYKISFKQDVGNIHLDLNYLKIISPFVIAKYLIKYKFICSIEEISIILTNSAAFCIQKLWYAFKLKNTKKIELTDELIIYI